MKTLLAATLACLLVGTVAGQGKVYVVDAANGAGTHFRSIHAAVKVAVDGDRLLVRKGTYAGFTVTRSISIVGAPGVILQRPCTFCSNSFLRIRLPAGKTFSMVNVDCQLGIDLNAFLNRGRILFDSVKTRYPLGFVNCDHVSLIRCTTTSVQAASSNVLIVDGKNIREVIATKSSHVALVNTSVTGAPGYWSWNRFYPAPSPIFADATSSIAINGTSGTLVQGGSTAHPVVGGFGTVLHDPLVRLRNFATGGAVFDTRLSVTRQSIPFVDNQGAVLGGTVRITMNAGANNVFFLAVGIPSQPVTIPGLGGRVWLNVNTAILVAVGQLSAKGQHTLAIPVPRDNLLLGRALVWQGTAGPTMARQFLSNPTEYVHRN